jgi:hypothetical protein
MKTWGSGGIAPPFLTSAYGNLQMPEHVSLIHEEIKIVNVMESYIT